MKTDVAPIGCGYWGKSIARSLASIGRLAVIVDDDTVCAKEFAAEYDCDALTFEEVVVDPGVPAVATATPAETHFALAHRALKAGTNVFWESSPSCTISVRV